VLGSGPICGRSDYRLRELNDATRVRLMGGRARVARRPAAITRGETACVTGWSLAGWLRRSRAALPPFWVDYYRRPIMIHDSSPKSKGCERGTERGHTNQNEENRFLHSSWSSSYICMFQHPMDYPTYMTLRSVIGLSVSRKVPRDLTCPLQSEADNHYKM
jgi:hypothetical protein